MKYIRTAISEQETIVNFLYDEQLIKIYSSRAEVIKLLTKALGNPTIKYKKSKSYWSGASWDVEFNDIKKIEKILIFKNFVDSDIEIKEKKIRRKKDSKTKSESKDKKEKTIKVSKKKKDTEKDKKKIDNKNKSKEVSRDKVNKDNKTKTRKGSLVIKENKNITKSKKNIKDSKVELKNNKKKETVVKKQNKSKTIKTKKQKSKGDFVQISLI